jgi:hypothetical protein
MPRWWVTERKKERRAYIEIIPERISSWDNTKLSGLVEKQVAHPAQRSTDVQVQGEKGSQLRSSRP